MFKNIKKFSKKYVFSLLLLKTIWYNELAIEWEDVKWYLKIIIRYFGLENNKVNIDQIKVAFREQAKKYHPDVNSGSFSEERFKDINEAYRVLSDSKEKRKYDRIWYSHIGRKIEKKKDEQSRETSTSFYNILFGTSGIKDIREEKINKKTPVKGENIDTEINISLEDAFYGKSKKISLRTVEGKMKTFDIKIPAGIRNGEKIRLIGEGKKGLNGAKNGDLFIKINIENTKKYKLQGYDIYTDLLITPWEAALGTKTEVDSIDEKNTVIIPKGLQTGETVRIPGKGYKNGTGTRGDLVAEIKITVPKELTEEEIKLYQKLKEISKFEPRN